MAPRWKGKGSAAKAIAEPMSKTITQLQSCLIHSDLCGYLSGSSVILALEAEQADLLNRSCFGHHIITADNDKQLFQLSMEEAFYLSSSLKCLKVIGDDNYPKTEEQLWLYMNSKREMFDYFYKAYSHLRRKNWVVRSGSQYGADFVAYRHHPALVHSEYAVIVLSKDSDLNGRLKLWSDIHRSVRLSGSVAKTLLVLNINKHGLITADSPSCLESYSIEERTITRWNPEEHRENETK